MKKILALLLTLALALGLCACGGSATEEPAQEETAQTEQTGDLEKIVITEQVRGYHWAPAYLAQTLGFFAEEGLDAEFQTVSGTDATAPVLSGDAQFCLKGVETEECTKSMVHSFFHLLQIVNVSYSSGFDL